MYLCAGGLLRWQISVNPFVTWDEIKKTVESLRPANSSSSGSGSTVNWEVTPSHFRRVDNPCVPDFCKRLII
jgi:hypothetical protein